MKHLNCLKSVRGIPPYWLAVQKDVVALIRQFGIPKKIVPFHLLFRWPEIVQIIMKQQGDTKDFEYHTWNDKCKILQSNPVTVARMLTIDFTLFCKKLPCQLQNQLEKSFTTSTELNSSEEVHHIHIACFALKIPTVQRKSQNL